MPFHTEREELNLAERFRKKAEQKIEEESEQTMFPFP